MIRFNASPEDMPLRRYRKSKELKRQGISTKTCTAPIPVEVTLVSFVRSVATDASLLRRLNNHVVSLSPLAFQESEDNPDKQRRLTLHWKKELSVESLGPIGHQRRR